MTEGPQTPFNAAAAAEGFIVNALRAHKYLLLKGHQIYWKRCEALARDLATHGATDTLINLTADDRPPVKYSAAVLLHEFRPDVTRNVLLELSKGEGWYAREAYQMLGLLFEEYFDMVFGPKTPQEVADLERYKKFIEDIRSGKI